MTDKFKKIKELTHSPKNSVGYTEKLDSEQLASAIPNWFRFRDCIADIWKLTTKQREYPLPSPNIADKFQKISYWDLAGHLWVSKKTWEAYNKLIKYTNELPDKYKKKVINGRQGYYILIKKSKTEIIKNGLGGFTYRNKEYYRNLQVNGLIACVETPEIDKWGREHKHYYTKILDLSNNDVIRYLDFHRKTFDLNYTSKGKRKKRKVIRLLKYGSKDKKQQTYETFMSEYLMNFYPKFNMNLNQFVKNSLYNHPLLSRFSELTDFIYSIMDKDKADKFILSLPIGWDIYQKFIDLLHKNLDIVTTRKFYSVLNEWLSQMKNTYEKTKEKASLDAEKSQYFNVFTYSKLLHIDPNSMLHIDPNFEVLFLHIDPKISPCLTSLRAIARLREKRYIYIFDLLFARDHTPNDPRFAITNSLDDQYARFFIFLSVMDAYLGNNQIIGLLRGVFEKKGLHIPDELKKADISQLCANDGRLNIMNIQNLENADGGQIMDFRKAKQPNEQKRENIKLGEKGVSTVKKADFRNSDFKRLSYNDAEAQSDTEALNIKFRLHGEDLEKYNANINDTVEKIIKFTVDDGLRTAWCNVVQNYRGSVGYLKKMNNKILEILRLGSTTKKSRGVWYLSKVISEASEKGWRDGILWHILENASEKVQSEVSAYNEELMEIYRRVDKDPALWGFDVNTEGERRWFFYKKPDETVDEWFARKKADEDARAERYLERNKDALKCRAELSAKMDAERLRYREYQRKKEAERLEAMEQRRREFQLQLDERMVGMSEEEREAFLKARAERLEANLQRIRAPRRRMWE